MLWQIFILLAVFFLIPLWGKLRVDFGISLMISGVLIALLTGDNISKIFNSFSVVFTTPSTVKNIVVVVAIGSIGAVMKKYDFLNKAVDALKALISSQKAVIMVLPAVIGMLSVPGGAQLSAPFVDKVGEELNIKIEHRSIINLSFRHMAMFLLPTSTALILMAGAAPEVNVYSLVLLNLGFVILMQLTSYFLYLRNIRDIKATTHGGKLKAAKNLLIYLSPIYIIVILNGIFKIEMYISVLLSVVLMFFICGTRDIVPFWQTAIKGIKLSTFLMMVGVFFMQDIIKNLDSLMQGVGEIFLQSSGIMIIVVIAAAAILFGMTTGLSYAAIGIIMPLVLSLNLGSTEVLIYSFIVFAFSFIGYYFSPLHLCQILTVKTIGCKTTQLYKSYIKLVPCVILYAVGLFYLYRFILL